MEKPAEVAEEVEWQEGIELDEWDSAGVKFMPDVCARLGTTR